MSTETISGEARHITSGRLWFGAAGAAIAWALQGFICFLISTQACANGTGSWGPISASAVRILIGMVSLLFLAVSVASMLVAWLNWRALTDGRHLLEAEGIPRENFMAVTGMFVGLACSIGLIWAGIPAVFFEVCNTWR
jgi:hypothetical protein